jgi:protein ImuA
VSTDPRRRGRPRPKTPATGEVPAARRVAEPSAARLAELRRRIRALEKPGENPGENPGEKPGESLGKKPGEKPGKKPGVAAVVPLGVPAIDGHLPEGGLRLAGLHEIAGAREEWDGAGGAGPVLWAARRADLYGPGVAGLMGPRTPYPGRLILVRARRDDEVLWALEEGLRAPPGTPGTPGTLAAVVGEVGAADAIATRRLQLAAEAAGRPCFLLRRRLSAGRAATAPAAALTRWRVGALPSAQGGEGGDLAVVGLAGRLAGGLTGELASLPGRPRWRVELLRCRGAAPGGFTVEWDDAAGDFALAAPVRDRPVAARPAAICAAG